MSNIAPTYAEFVIAYPVFVSPAVDELDVQRQLDVAERLLSKSAWGDFYSEAIMLLVAHNTLLWLRSQLNINGGISAASGNVASTSGAGLSISFESTLANLTPGSKSSAWYNKTVYGQEYLYLQSIVINSACLSY